MLYNYNMITIIIIAVLLLTFVTIAAVSTKSIRTTHIEFHLDNLPKEFDGCRLTQISDLHNSYFGKRNKRLIKAIIATNPLALLVTGDVTSGHSYVNPEQSAFYKLCNEIDNIPIYFILGNHEERLVKKLPNKYYELLDSFRKCGVTVLDDEKAVINIGNSHINIFGLSIRGVRHSGSNQYHIDNSLFETHLKAEPNEINILMAHIPQFFDIYVKHGYDIVLCGHMHGGIIRLPFVGGVLSPERKLFPKYCYGLFEKNKTKMFISAGLGKSFIPFRLFCRPEVVEITLKSNK